MVKVTLLQILDHYNIRVMVRKKGKGKIRCPFHEDRNPSCSVDLEKNMFYCFPCAVGGGVVKFVMLKEKVDRKQAVRHLKKLFKYEVKKEKEEDVLEIDLDGMSEDAKNLVKKMVGRRAKVNTLTLELLEKLSWHMQNDALFKKSGVVVGMLEWISEMNSKYNENEYFSKHGGELEDRERQVRKFLFQCNINVMWLRYYVKISYPVEKRRALYRYQQKGMYEEFFNLADEAFWDYRFKRELVEQIHEQLTVVLIKSFDMVKRAEEKEFNQFREKLVDMKMALDEMKKLGNDWYKAIGQLEWMKA